MLHHPSAAPADELRKVTFRKRGEAHRGFIRFYVLGGKRVERLSAACSCPGSNRGTLTNGAVILADGWEKATCRRA